MNTLYLGDCLNVLRESIKDESVDLIYIDPPFNSKRDYNIFFDDKEIQTQRVAYQVKGGYKVQSKDIDALLGAIEKHKCELGVFLTASDPTKPMLDTVASAGFVKFGDRHTHFEFPKLQVLTLKDYFAGKRPKLPQTNITFKAAKHSGKKKESQEALEL